MALKYGLTVIQDPRLWTHSLKSEADANKTHTKLRRRTCNDRITSVIRYIHVFTTTTNTILEFVQTRRESNRTDVD